MDTFFNICLVLAILVTVTGALYLAYRLFLRSRSMMLLQKIAQGNVDEPVGDMLRINYHLLPVLRDVIIPVRTQAGRIVFRAQHIVINRGGILLITECPQTGFIENPFQGEWRQFVRDQVYCFPNPLEANSRNGRILHAVLKRHQMENIPIRAVAVFPCERNKYKNRIEQVMPLSRLTRYIKEMNKNRYLSYREIFRAKSVIRQVSKKSEEK